MNSELIDIKLTVAPFLQINQIHSALNSIRVYQFIINKNLEEYYRNIELNPIDIKMQMEMDNIIGIMECLNLYQRDSYKATQRNLEILTIQKELTKILS